MGGAWKAAVVAGVAMLGVAGFAVGRALAIKPVLAGGGSTTAPSVPFDLNAAAAHLGEAVRIQTVSHQDPAANDASQWSALHAWLASTYPHFAAAAKREDVPGTSALVWTWRGSDTSLPPAILMAHQDVVPVDPATLGAWKQPPFSGALADDAVWGRGSVDDKASLVSLMEAGEALAASGFKPRRTVILVSGHDEEAGGAGARAAAALLQARGVHALYALDEGSAVLEDHPVTKGPAALIGVAEKGYATLRITARGAGGHSSAPPKEDAALAVAEAVVRIAGKPHPLRYGGLADAMMRGLAPATPFMTRLVIANPWLFGPVLKGQFAASPQGAAMLHTTLAPTMLEGSPKDNVLPEVATARINYRILPGDTSQAVMDRATAAVRGLPVTLAFEPTPREPSPVSSATSEGWRQVTGALAGSYGGKPPPIAPTLVIAATDSRSMSGVAQDVYRLQPIAFRLADTEMIHGVNENLRLTDLKRMIDFYARLIRGQ